jgi:hypothetical protein
MYVIRKTKGNVEDVTKIYLYRRTVYLLLGAIYEPLRDGRRKFENRDREETIS